MEAEQIDSDWFRYKCVKTGQILSLYNRTTGEYRCACVDKNKKKIAKICELLHSNDACNVCEPSGGAADFSDGLCTIMQVENDMHLQKSPLQTRGTEIRDVKGSKTPNSLLKKAVDVYSEDVHELVTQDESKSETNEKSSNNLFEETSVLDADVNQEDKNSEMLSDNTESTNVSTTLQSDEAGNESVDQSNAVPARRLSKKELNNKLKCTFCKKTFRFLSRLNMHLRSHTREKPFKCTYCDKAFGQKSTLMRHTRIHTEEKPFICKFCDMAFPTERRLTIHLKKHIEFRPYKCTFCEKAFKKRSEFCIHTRIHTGERPFHCTQRYCYKSFKQKSALDSHSIIHTGKRPHECMFCDMKFRQEHHLIVHLRRHTGEKPYQCTLCDKTFRHKTSLEDHLRSRMHASKD